MTDQPRILVVDDEPQLTRVLRTGLKSRGYDVRAAADGLAGFEAFNDWHPDLVITDLAMPNVDGLELCRRLRAVSQVPIIVLSAKGEEKTKVEALDLGADDFVTKPFGIDELLARVRASLRRANAPPMNEATQTTLDSGDFHVDLEIARDHSARQTDSSDAERIRSAGLLHQALRQSSDSPHAAGRVVGRQLRRTERVPARLRRQPPQKDRTRRRQATLHPHRTLDRLPLRSRSELATKMHENV